MSRASRAARWARRQAAARAPLGVPEIAYLAERGYFTRREAERELLRTLRAGFLEVKAHPPASTASAS